MIFCLGEAIVYTTGLGVRAGVDGALHLHGSRRMAHLANSHVSRTATRTISRLGYVRQRPQPRSLAEKRVMTAHTSQLGALTDKQHR